MYICIYVYIYAYYICFQQILENHIVLHVDLNVRAPAPLLYLCTLQIPLNSTVSCACMGVPALHVQHVARVNVCTIGASGVETPTWNMCTWFARPFLHWTDLHHNQYKKRLQQAVAALDNRASARGQTCINRVLCFWDTLPTCLLYARCNCSYTWCPHMWKQGRWKAMA